MKFGVAMLVTDLSMGPADFGRAVEERGFESLFVPEHTHVPVHAVHRGDASLGAAETRQGLDPFVALTAVAAATTRLRIGTGVCLAAQRDPIILAKEVASLDVVSGGRFLFGVGAGWHEEEMLNHGVDPRTRVARLHEHLEAMRTIWRDYEASHHGRHVKFDPIWSLPKPVQRPHPPILLGGGPRVLQRALALGAAWMPWHEVEGADLTDRVARLDALAAAQGHAPVPVTVMGVPPEETVLARYAEAGVARCVLALPSSTGEEVLPLLDWYADLAAHVN